MIAQWQHAVVLRPGKFVGIKRPKLFFFIPLVESVSNVVDRRTISSTFRAEQTITADMVPVVADMVLEQILDSRTRPWCVRVEIPLLTVNRPQITTH